MRTVRITDITLGNCTSEGKYSFTFRKKIEAAKLLDKAGVDISLGKLSAATADTMLIKSIASEIGNSVLSVCADMQEAEIRGIWNALKEAKHPRLELKAALSTSRMEYVYHKKAADMLQTIASMVTLGRSLCDNVEFVAEDATRADYAFLCQALLAAVDAGATAVTVCDTAGTMLPAEFGDFVAGLREEDGLKTVTLGVSCSNALNTADASAVAAIQSGADEIKCSAVPGNYISLKGVADVLKLKAQALGVTAQLNTTVIYNTIDAVKKLGKAVTDTKSPFENGVGTYNGSAVFTETDGIEEIAKGAVLLGYDLDEGDKVRVYGAFKKAVSRKGSLNADELDALIAAEAMQVPATYALENYVVTTGNAIDIVAHIKLKRNGKFLDGLSVGDGPIDAAFLAIENITGHHYELDDFQIKAITEGRGAMGQTVVKLRSRGKVYSGIGISTDIVGSGVAAYINALNKICFEEENQ